MITTVWVTATLLIACFVIMMICWANGYPPRRLPCLMKGHDVEYKTKRQHTGKGKFRRRITVVVASCKRCGEECDTAGNGMR